MGGFFYALAYTLPLFAAALWFGGTAWLWRSNTDSETHVLPTDGLCGVHCPQCSYNLTGLREVRCPECGWASTVDDIVNRSLAGQIALTGGSV